MARYDRKDAHYRRARDEGYRSRAAFKLEELGQGVLRRGAKVLDLGCWPGGWLQVASRAVGDTGVVVGVDRREGSESAPANVRLIVGDVGAPETREAIREALGGPADVVVSDMAPSLSGIRDRDHAAAERLAEIGLDVAIETLAPGGAFVCKTFMTPAHSAFVDSVRRVFREVTVKRSKATRKGSAELYVVARGFSRNP